MSLFRFFILSCLSLNVVGAIAEDTQKTDHQKLIGQFAQQAKINVWPQLRGCSYEQRFGEEDIAGVLLEVFPTNTEEQTAGAIARWDGSCHVPMRHILSHWPADKPRGHYLVAVKIAHKQSHWEHTYRRLDTVAVFDSLPMSEALEEAVLARICAPRAKTNIDKGFSDRSCEELRNKKDN